MLFSAEADPVLAALADAPPITWARGSAGIRRQPAMEETMPEFGVDQARQRVLDTMYAGNWPNVDAQLTAYGAALRAEERRSTLDDALAALKDYADAHADQRDAVQACIEVVQRLA